MKKILAIITILLAFKCSAQITYEHSYPGPNSASESRLVIINMGGSDGVKYFYVDYQANTLELFNLDHSHYITINVPIQLINSSENRIGYITRSLFDCDSSMFEYAVLPSNWRNAFAIYRQDGTLIFKRDSTIAPYCVGCYDLSYDVVPIYNTPAGAKLILAKADGGGLTNMVDVYSLCGMLPSNIGIIDPGVTSNIKIFPNPSENVINFEIAAPNNFENFALVVFDLNGLEIRREIVNSQIANYKMDVSRMVNGLYTFSLLSGNKILDSGKFIISR